MNAWFFFYYLCCIISEIRFTNLKNDTVQVKKQKSNIHMLNVKHIHCNNEDSVENNVFTDTVWLSKQKVFF